MAQKPMLTAVAAVAMTILSLSAFTTAPGSAPTSTKTIAVAPAAAPAVTRSKAVPHPEIRKAIVALQVAKSHLEHAAHDFGGHRVAAIAACDNALAQLRLALQYDK